MTTLLERYGRIRVARVVHDFYRRVLRSPRLGPYFRGVDMEGLVTHQAVFMTAAMGESLEHTRGQIREVHAPYQISDEAFEEMLGLLNDTLIDHGLEPGDAASVIEVYRSYQPEVTSGRS